MTTPQHSSFWPTWEENKPFALLLLILLAYGIVYLGMKIARLNEPEPYEHQITVEGEADGSAINDIATVTIGVDTKGDEVASAQAENSTTMNALVEKVKAIGIDTEDIQTSYYNVYENTEWNGEEYVSNGWIVSNQIEVKIRDNALVAQVLNVAGQEGATNISGPSFAVDDTGELKDQVRTAAIANAREKAAALSSTLGIELKEIVGYSEWSEGDDSHVYRSYKDYTDSFGGGAPDVEPGSEELTLHVSITYTLAE